jgi:Low molecular weight phosphotyrosine protein phosphatase
VRVPYFLMLIFALVISGDAFARTPTILFVCQFGSVKSPLARELFRRRAQERGITVNAFSRGITPEAHVAPRLRAALESEGINPEYDGLNALRRNDLRRATVTVLFDPLPVGWTGKRVQDWTDTGSLNESYETEKPRLLARIEALLDTLSKQRQR